MRLISFHRIAVPAVLAALFCAGPAVAQELEFKKLTKKRRTITLRDCELIPEVTRIMIEGRGKLISLPASQNRESYKLPKRYTYFACGDNGTGADSVFAKETEDGEAVEFDLDENDFPKGQKSELNKACNAVQGWPGAFIYKTIGSNHFTDIRRNTIGMIVKPGVYRSWPSCLYVLDKKGNALAKLGLYATGSGWSARYYAGWGCGAGTPYNGAKVASIARSKSGDSDIYFDFGSTCYGPIDASRCIGSAQC